MKNWIIFVLCIFFCVQTKDVFANLQVINKVVAIVGNNVILESDINKVLIMLKHNIQESNQEILKSTRLRYQILDQIIMDSIILQLAEQNNISVNNDYLDKIINNTTTQYYWVPNQLKGYVTHNNLDYKNHKEQTRKEILINEILNHEVSLRLSILPQEVDLLAQHIATQINNKTEFNLSHILIMLPKNYKYVQLDKLEALANHLVEQGKNGANFNKLATTYFSDSKLIKIRQINWEKLENFSSLFIPYLQNVKKGSVIGPIRSSIGFHIFKVNDTRNYNRKIVTTEVCVRHILLRNSKKISDQKIFNKLKNIISSINNGYVNFNTLIKELSKNFSSINQVNNLDWKPINAFNPIFHHILINLKKGEISMPIRSSYGWHIIQLIDVRHVDYINAYKNYAYQLLFNRKFIEESKNWMQEQRASVYVKIINNNEQ